MSSGNPEVVVAGHICIDLIPDLDHVQGDLGAVFTPGKLVNVGPAAVSTGGSVSNTGLALHRLGVATALMGKVGTDVLGRAVLDALREREPALAEGMIVEADAHSSYTIVINPPGVDRIFLHCPGANDTFGADDVDYDAVAAARLFHFGYPPLMRRMFLDDGAELAAMFQRVKDRGVTTSLDMAWPDPASEAGKVDWPAVLERTLRHVDLFLPSLDETLLMLDPARFARLQAAGGQADAALLAEISQRLLEMGAAIVVLKLGEHGLYLRTAADRSRIEAAGPAAPKDTRDWTARELLSACFAVEVAGTTGAGDCTIAGFLAGLLKGQACEDAMTSAVAVGACNVEHADATSGVPHWEAVQERIRRGWDRRPVGPALPGWQRHDASGVWCSPDDARSA